MNQLIYLKDPKSPVSEQYRVIRTNLEFSNLDNDLKVICVTSSIQNEGKSTVVANLAATFQQLDKKILVIDADLRNPTLNKLFGVMSRDGLTDVLASRKTLDKCINKIENVDVLIAGSMPPNPAEVLASRKMREFINSIREEYDYIFIDSPPIGQVADAGIISSYCDGVIFVVGSNEVESNMAKIAKERLESVNANILGVILNKFKEDNGSYNYYYSSYYSGDKKGKRKKHKKRK